MSLSLSRNTPEGVLSGSAARHLPTVTAHAGSLHTTANSRESFQAALAFPVGYLEADVRFTPDNDAYLAHDPLPEPLRQKAMRLEDLLKLVAPHPNVRLLLDMKETSGIREMVELVKRSGMASRVILAGLGIDAASSVRGDADGLTYLLNARPKLWQRVTAFGAAALVREIRACGASGLNVQHPFLTRRIARAVSAAGLSVWVWTVDDEREMRRILRLPVDNIITRRVDLLIALREQMGR